MAAVGWGVSGVFAGPAARRGSPLAVTIWSQALGLLCGLPALIFVSASLADGALEHGAVAGLGSGIGLLLLYSSARYLYVGVAAAISAVMACVIPVGYAALTQPLSVREGLGVTVCVLALLSLARWRGDSRAAGDGVVLVPPGSTQRAVSGTARLRPEILGIGAALASGLGMGVYYIALAGAAPGDEIGEALESRLVSAVMLCLIALVVERSSLRPPRSTLWSAFATGAFGIVGALAYATAVQTGRLAVIVPIVSLSPAVTIAAAWLVLSERLSNRQLAGLILAMAGVVIVTA